MNLFKEFVVASAPGKVILFGEHAVVYGQPAISMAISLKSSCSIKVIKEQKIVIELANFKKKFEFKDLAQLGASFPPNFQFLFKGIELLAQQNELSLDGIRIKLASQLLPAAGIGSSASIAVAMAAAFSEFYELKFDKRIISDIAFQMEKVNVLNPSGIDNTNCTFGNIIYFLNKNYEILKVPSTLKLLVSYTGLDRHTGKAISKIKQLKDSIPSITDPIINLIGDLTKTAKKELETGNLENIGKLMNINQGLLDALGVSNHRISRINEIALKNGALGSKLTGGGLGGCAISLVDDDNLQRVSDALKEKRIRNFHAQLDMEGVKIEKSK